MTEPGLKRALRLRDLILLNIVAVFTPGTISQTLMLGWAGLLLWVAGLLAFMLPYAAAIADLSLRYPREGGIYAWTRMALGGFHGFVCGWCYWVNTFLYVPSVFLGLGAVAALLGGEKTSWLAERPEAALFIACAALWLSAGLHIVGLGQGKWIQNIGAFGRLAIAFAILGASAWKLFASGGSQPAPQPAPGFWPTLALWPFALNALVGLDLGSAMSEEAGKPERDIPRSLLVGGSAVAICYLLSYSAVVSMGASNPDPIYGHVQAINSVLGNSWLAGIVIAVEFLGLLGCGASWLSAPARIPFAIGIDRYLPNIFGKVHPRFGTPYVALLTQAVMATGLIIVNTYGVTLKEGYLALLGSSIVLVMLTYIYLFIAWLRLRTQAGAKVVTAAATGLLAAGIAVAAGFIPPPAVEEIGKFQIKIVGSVAFLLFWGLVLYWLGSGRQEKSAKTVPDMQ